MQIKCPFCGPRDVAEFSYFGDADNAARRPAPALENSDEWNSFVYDRANPAGTHDELWQHGGGCRRFLTVTRNTVTHEITKVRFANGGGKS